MNKLVYGLAGGVVGAVAASMVLMMPPANKSGDDALVIPPSRASAHAETAENDSPFAGLQKLLDEDGPDLGLTEEQIRVEEDFLSLDLGDKTDTSDVVPLKNAQNQRAVTCPKIPEVADREYLRGVSASATRRWIYSYVRAKNVVDTKDCSCTGKMPPFAPVYAIQKELEAQYGEDWADSGQQKYIELSEEYLDKAEAMCGGEF